MAESHECLRCHTPLEPGFIADRTYGGFDEERWSPGQPQTHWWGLEKPKDTLPVSAMRCPRCGMLELVAPPA
jgi:hypothetical protein